MDIYSKKQKWKFTLLGFAIIIGLSSLFVTNRLVKQLKNEERKKIELWAHATKHLVSITGEGDYSLAIKVISENSNIPVILVDECDSILEHRNFNHYSKVDSLLLQLGLIQAKEITKPFLRKELNLIRKGTEEPIEINIIGDKQWIYYKDSALLYRLRYYPIYQLGFIGLFMFIAYFMFSASRKSEQNKVWAGMAKETAHQIGTPLSSLMAWIELLKEKEGTESMVFEMEKDINRLETITDRFSKIGSKSELQKRDVVHLIRQSVEYLKSRMPVNTLFTLDFPKKEIIIPINSILLEWVVENLVKNAVDSMKGKGEIKISITEDANNLILNITDNGDGIDRSILKNIFKPGVTSKKRGWGLGLSLSKRIIEEYHKGSIFVMQSEKGIGTTFSIQLPKNLNSTTS
ncbi:HAMP domain-containing histidine kinase [Flavobacteriales bacterium]|jgi:two-component sensor histidine kinase|nr:HAMP domain-containing histidine kinase [Flavobacteriales bacterium]MDC3305844.1 HAMP domain-containing histidine kinase [Flavobacteriales bacterium]MDG1348540.1 HAMP domain-containing sensor histidine kinase [Flavobacteriales bacterium]|tara:strand:+ start:29231 stop:30442 length:1212 start_codon:yes stop_codon:yes gene_type:complete